MKPEDCVAGAGAADAADAAGAGVDAKLNPPVAGAFASVADALDAAGAAAALPNENPAKGLLAAGGSEAATAGLADAAEGVVDVEPNENPVNGLGAGAAGAAEVDGAPKVGVELDEVDAPKLNEGVEEDVVGAVAAGAPKLKPVNAGLGAESDGAAAAWRSASPSAQRR